MKKLNVKAVKVISSIVLTLVLTIVCAVTFSQEETVALISGESYSPIYFGNREKAQVAIMVNVYENGDIVEKMVEVFESYSVKATFFVGGCWADDNTETLRLLRDKGFEIGNHGYFHKDHKKITEKDNEQEILHNHELIFALIGVEMNLFAPPSGAFSKTTLQVAEKLGYRSIMWSKDTIDWRDSDVQLIVKRATENVQNGDLILMHPKEHTLKALPYILDYYKEKKLVATTVSQCIL